MAVLVGYDSSDEEDVQAQAQVMDAANTKSTSEPIKTSQGPEAAESIAKDAPTVPAPSSSSQGAPTIGPSLGPRLPSAEDILPGLEDAYDDPDAAVDSQAPASPYSANRALLRDLTLPQQPNMDMPPSPTGTPPPGLDELNKKFQNFLDLKKKGTHFNERLADSAALKNPALMDKLMAFVALEGVDQYVTTLDTDLWDPAALPDWANYRKLRASHDEVRRKREADRAAKGRDTVEFVPASGTAPGSQLGTPGAPAPAKRKTRFE